MSRYFYKIQYYRKWERVLTLHYRVGNRFVSDRFYLLNAVFSFTPELSQAFYDYYKTPVKRRRYCNLWFLSYYAIFSKSGFSHFEEYVLDRAVNCYTFSTDVVLFFSTKRDEDVKGFAEHLISKKSRRNYGKRRVKLTRFFINSRKNTRKN